jgi:hypothetical protein
MARNKITLFILINLSIFLYAEDESVAIDINSYQRIIFTILDNLSDIIENNPASEIVYSTYSISENAIRNNELTFKISTNSNTVLGGMSFNIYESGEISLVFGLKYLDTYNPNSSIHYSILIHEYRHLCDYLRNSEAFVNAKARNDFKESYWYELDALRIEAEFIKYYLVGKFSLSRFEEYILESFERDNLDSASIFLQRESMYYFFYFDNMETRYREKEISKEEIINRLEREGEMLINKFYEGETQFSSFVNYIEISTFRKYLTRILAILVGNPVMTWGEVFEQYPKIGEIYAEMSNILNTHNSEQAVYLNSVYQIWENDILNR